ncbi:MAG: NAD(P)/FAD-dependent oxidoreductase [Nocardioidaceae bacterium]
MIDLLVAGGGPVGLATALLAHRRGLSVEVVEPRDTPVDKACGEGLMPGAVAALHRLGIDLDGQALHGIRYTDGNRDVVARFAAGNGVGVRRTTLQAGLAAAVSQEGITVHRRLLGRVEQDARGVYADGLRAAYLAAADGLHSPLRRQLGLDRPAATAARFGLRRHFTRAPWTDLVEVHWAAEREAYVTPVAPDLVGVAVLTDQREPFDEQLRSFPKLLERLEGSASGDVRGAGPLLQRSRSRVCGRVLLVGDAAGYVDALTGEGISVGLSSAQALVDCVAADDPAAYERRWKQATRSYRWPTSSLLWSRNQRLTAPLIVPAAVRLPRVFSAAVNQLAR